MPAAAPTMCCCGQTISCAPGMGQHLGFAWGVLHGFCMGSLSYVPTCIGVACCQNSEWRFGLNESQHHGFSAACGEVINNALSCGTTSPAAVKKQTSHGLFQVHVNVNLVSSDRIQGTIP
jgi:hypothetical protein